MKKETQAAKQAIIDQITADFKGASSVTIVDYRGLTVNETEELRHALYKDGARMKVYKNTYVDRAIDSLGYDDLKKDLVGPNALVFSHDDSIAGPRNVVKFAKMHPNLQIKRGIFDGKIIGVEEVQTIASLPNREGLLSMLLSCLQAPVRGFACAVKAIGEKQEKEAAPSAAPAAPAAPAA